MWPSCNLASYWQLLGHRTGIGAAEAHWGRNGFTSMHQSGNVFERANELATIDGVD